MVLDNLQSATIEGKISEVESLVKIALDEGVAPLDIINKGLVPAMGIVGEKFKNNEIFVPEMLISAKAMQSGVNIVEPLILTGERTFVGKAVIGTVKGDLHDIGKNLVIMMLRASGWEVIDLGVDVASSKFVEAIKEHKPDFVGLSALLTTTMPVIKTTVEDIKEAGLRESVKILVGGAPVTPEYAKEAGADGYASDAGSVMEVAKSLIV